MTSIGHAFFLWSEENTFEEKKSSAFCETSAKRALTTDY